MHNFEIMYRYVQFADFWSKPDPNPKPIPKVTLIIPNLSQIMQHILQTTDWQIVRNVHTWTEIHNISAYIKATIRIPVYILTLSYTRLCMLSNRF